MRFLRVPGQLTERWLHSRLTINHLTQHCDYYERALPPLSSTWSEIETSVERSSHHVHS